MSDGPAVGVVGRDRQRAVAAVEAAGGDPVAGPAGRVVGACEYVLAVGESALLAAARAGPNAPVLPVAAGRGVRSVPGDALEEDVAALLAGDYDRETHVVSAVTAGEATRGTVVFDASLVTAEPADISEFAVHADGERVSRFRADGVVVATPAGSGGYARRAGGPVVSPGTAGAVVVPIAPFATDADHWVVPPAGVRVSVEREEAPVCLIADGRMVGPVSSGEQVRVRPAGELTVAVVDGSVSRFGSK